MNNMPEVKVGIVAVSRDCFPESLSVNRRKALVEAYAKKYDAKDIYECPICIVESEIHMVQALEDIKKAGCNALCVYLGNFGPEISETLLAKHFDGPKMFIAAAEETQNDLCQGRGDAYCGMLNASYNLQLRNVKAYIPEYPVGDAEDCAERLSALVLVHRTSLLVMLRSNSFTTLVWKSKKTLNWICLKHSTNMKVMKEFRKSLKKWKKSLVPETRNRKFFQNLLSTN